MFHLLETLTAYDQLTAGAIQFFHKKLDQGGLTGSTASYNKHELTFINMQIHMVNGRKPFAI